MGIAVGKDRRLWLATGLACVLACLGGTPTTALAQNSCSSLTFDVPIGEDTGASDAFAPGDDVVEIALAARDRRSIVRFSGCQPKEASRNPNPGFGVVPATVAGTRRIIDERRDQVGRDVGSLRSTSAKRSTRGKRTGRAKPAKR